MIIAASTDTTQPTTPPGDHLAEATIPDWVLDADVSAQAIRLYAVLRLHADRCTDGLIPSRPVLADRLHVKELRTVTRLLRELDDAGTLATIPLIRQCPPSAAQTPRARRQQANRNIHRAFRRIGERDGFHCRACGLDRTLTVDHVLAVINGGTDDDDNLQLLCRSHNGAKGAR